MKKRKIHNGGIINSYNHRDLRVQYDNLCESYFHKFFYRNRKYVTEEEFRAQIDLEFELCCKKYDPHRGIDFPGYIKNSLKWGVMKYIDEQKAYYSGLAFIDDEENDSNAVDSDRKSLLSEEARILIYEDKNLTDYDKKLIELAVEGLTTKEIAERLNMKEKDVEEDMNYLANYILMEV